MFVVCVGCVLVFCDPVRAFWAFCAAFLHNIAAFLIHIFKLHLFFVFSDLVLFNFALDVNGGLWFQRYLLYY